MSILTNCEIKCDCGEKFEAEVWKAVNIFDDPDLKEVVLSGQGQEKRGGRQLSGSLSALLDL